MSRRDVGVRVTCALAREVHCAVAGPVDAASVKNIVLVQAPASTAPVGTRSLWPAVTAARSRPRPEETRASWGGGPAQRTISR